MPRRGVVIQDHHEIIHVLETCLDAGVLAQRFELFHLDAHADMGVGPGDLGYVEVLGTLTRIAPSQRPRHRKHLGPGNWLVYAVAYDWLERVVHVKWGGRHEDLHRYYFRDADLSFGEIIVVPLDDPEAAAFRGVPAERDVLPSIVPPTPLELPLHSNFSMPAPPDLVVVCHSPEYTPRSADPLLARIIEMLVPLPDRASIGW